MLPPTNIAKKLSKRREKRISSESIMAEIGVVFAENEAQREQIRIELSEKNDPEGINCFQFDALDPQRIFHLSDLKKLCIDYRLRFVDAHYFKVGFPEDAITAIRKLEKEHGIRLQNFKLIAPAKRLKLENADDPLLLAPMGNDYFYLVHQWGNDLHPLRKWLVWPIKTLENLVLTIFLFSVLLTAIIPLELIVDEPGVREKIILFMFLFNWTGGMIILLGIGKGKNVNEEIWNSKYYNG